MVWSTYYNDKVPHATREMGSFWWKDVLRLNNLYRGVAQCTIGDGSTTLFWDDLWSPQLLVDAFPRLFSFAKSDHSSVKQIMQAQDLESIFVLPLSQDAYQEFQDLRLYIQNIVYDEDGKDQWTFNAPPTFTWL